MFAPVLFESITGRAAKGGIIDLRLTDIREFSKDKHKKTDDYPYGGGWGMVMTPQPLYDAWRSAAFRGGGDVPTARTIYMGPQGAKLTQKKALELSKEKHLVIVCGRYEGVDERVLELIADEELSIGDYVLTGGEIPAMALIDCITRLLPGTLPDDEAFIGESHYNGLLEYPQYTRPPSFMGKGVPELLLNGNHKDIGRWRAGASIGRTRKKRPDLLAAHQRRYSIGTAANMRDMGGYAAKGGAITRWRVFLRSDRLYDFGEDGKAALLGLGLTTIIDLRSNDEAGRAPNSITQGDGVDCHLVQLLPEPLINKAIDEKPFEELYILFAERGKKKIGKVFKIMAKCNGLCLFHCHAGKDRTGIIATLLLLLAGVSRDDVIADYQVSGTYFRTKINQAASDINEAYPKTIEHFIAHIEKKYGGAEAYLLDAGLTVAEIEMLLDKFLGYAIP